MLVLDASGAVVRAGRVLRVRSDLETTTIFFDRVCATDAPVPAASLSLTPPSSGGVGRISWESFVSALSEAFGKTSDASDEIDAASNQSLVPSSFGVTFCVDGDVERIEIEARWGRYERVPNDEHELTRPNGQKAKVWQRIPCGGKLVLPLTEGVISHRAPDPNHPAVRIQGSVRARNAKGDRLVTLFLVNAHEEPDTNPDTAWLFQPELIVRAEPQATQRAIFRRRPVLEADGMDLERESLEMIYRNRVEFAVGHGVAVHAETAEDDPTRAIEIRTVVVPQYEVQVTETPGLDRTDRPAMRDMVASGLLDMQYPTSHTSNQPDRQRIILKPPHNL